MEEENGVVYMYIFLCVGYIIYIASGVTFITAIFDTIISSATLIIVALIGVYFTDRKTRRELKTSQSTIKDTLSKEHDELKTSQSTTKDTLSKEHDELKISQSTIKDTLSKEHAEIKKCVNSVTVDVKEKLDVISNGKIQELKEETKEIRGKLETLYNSHLESKQVLPQNLSNSLDGINNFVQQNMIELKAKDSYIKDLNNNINELTNNIASLNNEILQNTSKIEEQDQTINELKQQVIRLKQENYELKSEIDEPDLEM
jgi:hypothetical protein